MHSMQFHILGRVYEQESGLGVKGLFVRAYDKDQLYENLLGTATTGAEGRFKLSYTEPNFRELFDHQPDIYLAIYAPPCRFLVHTEEAIHWNTNSDEKVEVSIPRRKLGTHTPLRPDGQVKAGISLPKGFLKIEKRGQFDVPSLPGFVTTGVPGAPAVPQQMRYVALPLGGDVLHLDVVPGKPVRLAGPFNAFPAQSPLFDRGIPGEVVPHHLTPPDPRYFEGQARYPGSLAQLVTTEEIGLLQVAAILVRPVQYEPATRSYLFYPNLKYAITFDYHKAKAVAAYRRGAKFKVGELRAEQLNAFLQSVRVDVAKDLGWTKDVFIEETPHLIITDNYRWPESVSRGDGTTQPPQLPDRGSQVTGNLVAEFQRLADRRTSQGIRSRVVTVSEIVGGDYGDFTEHGFARDLPEVIRNFIKHTFTHWGTLYVVLGGGVHIVPMRYLIGMGPNVIERGAGVFRQTDNNPPHAYECYFLSGKSACKLHPDRVYLEPKSTDPLCTHHGGHLVPYNEQAGPSNLGWYFTTADDFQHKEKDFTRLPASQPNEFVIVEGPESIINDDFYWVVQGNSIPSDFYYASLVGSGYSVTGRHDFDDNDNNIYGQSHWDEKTSSQATLDKVAFHSDVWVGRIPAENAADVQAFVDKITTYEDLCTPGDAPSPVDPHYLRKVLYAAEYWVPLFQYRQYVPDNGSATPPPNEGLFIHIDTKKNTRIHTAFDLEMVNNQPSHRLIACIGQDKREIPYNPSLANIGVRSYGDGWFFMTDDNYNAWSATPTRYIMVYGMSENSIDASIFFWDPIGLELATEEKEHLRQMMEHWFPSFDVVERHYFDYFDLMVPPQLIPLEAQSLRDAINCGQHFISLSGHGQSKGCCTIDCSKSYPNGENYFLNANNYFIAFANSCFTARPDYGVSLGKMSVLTPHAGAVAYVGSSRGGFCGVGDNYEEAFWCILKKCGQIGPAAGFRLATGGVSDIWTFYTLTLYGDPAMFIWKDVPKAVNIKHKDYFQVEDTFSITVQMAGKPICDARVTLSGGRADESVFLSKKTNPRGQASFILPAAADRLGTLQVVVTSHEGQLYRGLIRNNKEKT